MSIQHDHARYIPGCFRCDLSRNENTPKPLWNDGVRQLIHQLVCTSTKLNNARFCSGYCRTIYLIMAPLLVEAEKNGAAKALNGQDSGEEV